MCRYPIAFRPAASLLGPQKDHGCHQAKTTSASVENAPPPDHAARLRGGGLRRRVHQAAVGRHDHKDRVRPICNQDRGSEQPASIEVAEKGGEPKASAEDSEARLHYEAPLVSRLPLGEERAIVKLKACRLLGDVDVDRGQLP